MRPKFTQCTKSKIKIDQKLRCQNHRFQSSRRKQNVNESSRTKTTNFNVQKSKPKLTKSSRIKRYSNPSRMSWKSDTQYILIVSFFYTFNGSN